MPTLKTLALVLVLLTGCSSPVQSGGVDSSEAGAPDVGAAGSVAVAGSAPIAGRGEGGSSDVAEAGSSFGGAAQAGSNAGGSAGALEAGTSAGGAGGAIVAGAGGATQAGAAGAPLMAGSNAGGSAGALEAGGNTGGSAGAPEAGSSFGGAAQAGAAGSTSTAGASSGGAAGAPGVECPYHLSTESISAQYGHSITMTFSAYTIVQAVDLSPLNGYAVTPFVDGVQSAKAFPAAGVYTVPPVNRLKSISFTITPYTATPLQPATGLTMWCK